MCGCYDQDETIENRLPASVLAALKERTRATEAVMDGNRVSDTAWAVFFGQASGGIEWKQFQRMTLAHQRASTQLFVQTFTRQHLKLPKVLNCERI